MAVAPKLRGRARARLPREQQHLNHVDERDGLLQGVGAARPWREHAIVTSSLEARFGARSRLKSKLGVGQSLR